MDKDLQDKLFAAHPSWFKRTDPTHSNMCYGFDCGDGWYNIINDLCTELAKIVDEHYEVIQVKEKLGGLRFYSHFSINDKDHYTTQVNEQIFALVHAAEEKSYQTCEICGKPGKKDSYKGWLKTLCEGCQKQRRLEY